MVLFLLQIVLFSVPAFAQQGTAIERGLRAGAGAGVQMRLRASFEAAPCPGLRFARACAARGRPLGFDIIRSGT